MKNKNLFVKIVFIALIGLLLLSLVAPAIFSQTNLQSPKRETLLNGMKVLMWNDAKADKVWVKIRIHSGSAFDPQGKEGVMQMLAANIFPNEATKEFFADDLGGSLEVLANYDYIQINASSKPADFLTMLETLSTAVSSPVIEKETTAKLKSQMTEKVKALESDTAYVADQAVGRRLLGTFPYGRPQFGTETSIKAIEFPDLIDAKQRFLSADNATVAVSGNFDRSLGLKAIRRYFGGWLKSDRRVPSTFRQPDDPPAGIQTVASPKPGTAAIRAAIRGVARSDKDLAASLVFAQVLETRLKSAVPAARAGDVFVRNDAHTLPGIMVIGFSIDRDSMGGTNAKMEANDLVGKALADPIAEAEFQSARNAAKSIWTARDPISFWLDADTFKIGDPNADFAILDTVNISDVRSFAERLRQRPIATVLVNTPPASN